MNNKILALVVAAILMIPLIVHADIANPSIVDTPGKVLLDQVPGTESGTTESKARTLGKAIGAILGHEFRCHDDDIFMVSVPVALGADPGDGDLACVERSKTISIPGTGR
jgi:hypothetical protein